MVPCYKQRGPVWHKSDIKQNRLPVTGIDTDAKWGYSKSKGWIFGYKLHMSCILSNISSSTIFTLHIFDNQLILKLTI